MNARDTILVVIPARGNSKGIPRKNLRMLAGRPLIHHAIQTAEKATLVDRVVVTTEDSEIASIARQTGVQVVERPARLAGDAVTLDSVVLHAVESVETDGWVPDYVLTIQPTSPLLRPESVDAAVEILRKGECETVISAVDARHLTWGRDEDGRFTPDYDERVNRQELPPRFQETGGIIGCRRDVLAEGQRIGDRVSLLELTHEEAVDIDDFFDWWIAEKALQRREVLIRVEGDRSIGLGHVYRCLSLAARLTDHHVSFLMSAKHPLGIELVRERNFPVRVFDGGDGLAEIGALAPDIVINDILDTDAKYIAVLKQLGMFVVNFEDLGPGAEHAHLVVNALYEAPHPRSNHVWGPGYDCLREEFYCTPRKVVEPEVRRILVTFGGADPSDLTVKALRALDRIRGAFDVEIILGLAYDSDDELRAVLEELELEPVVRRNVRSMSEHILDADVVITSAGRTVLEVASIGTPCVVLCQNGREMRHVHARAEFGVLNLGLGELLSVVEFSEHLQEVVDDYDLRIQANEQLLGMGVRDGCRRITELISEQYQIFERERQG